VADMNELLAELEKRRGWAADMGGAERIARQHAQGKLTARERLDLLFDTGTFREFGTLVGKAHYDDGQVTSVIPKGEIKGTGRIQGRLAFVTANDITSKGDSNLSYGLGLGVEATALERAREWGLPYVRLIDGAGGSVGTFDELGRTYIADGNRWSQVDVELLQHVPVASAILGPAAGIHAVNACLSHFNVMVKHTSHVFPGGPPVVKAALGMDISKEDLGGYEIHTQETGTINNSAETEADAIAQVKLFLSFMPSNVSELPSRNQHSVREARVPRHLLRSVVPESPRQPMDTRLIIDAVVDDSSFFEISPDFGRSRITGLARLDGYPVGIMANNPRYLGGATDSAAGEKVIRLIQLCDMFNLPLIDIADEPGFMVGPAAEAAAIERAGARLVAVICRSRCPWLTIVAGRVFGVGGQCHNRPSGMYRRYAWPNARWGSMHIRGGVSAAYRRQIENSPDPEATRRAIEERLEELASPFRTAEATGQDIIDPAETRELAVEFVQQAQATLQRQLTLPRQPFLP
jgi:methylmalonyl-CoA decarboxylase subunit alpha